jgi:hypothetical protein
MSTENETAGTDAGQQAASQEATGEAGKQALESVESTSESTLYDGMTGDKLHESYKSVQGEYTKTNQRLKELEGKFDTWGGVDKLLETADYLSNNPRFSEFIAQEKMRNQYGFDESQMDDEQKKAMDIVKKIATETNQATAQELYKKHIEPLENTLKDQTLEAHFSAMDEKHSDWRDVQDIMVELSDGLDESITDNPSFKDIETLYYRALVESGKIDDYAANLYQKKLEEKKNKDTGQPPGGQGERGKVKASSMLEAYNLAKQEHGSAGQ